MGALVRKWAGIEDTYETRKRKLGHEKVRVGLVATDLLQRESAGAVAAPAGLGHRVASYLGWVLAIGLWEP